MNVVLNISRTGNLTEIGDLVRDRVAVAVEKAATAAGAEMQERIETGAKTGRIYKRRGGDHQASAPGESPANDTGALAASIHADTSHAADDLSAEVIIGEAADAPKVLALEYGMVNGKIAPRPFITPAVETQRKQFPEAVAGAVRDGIAEGRTG